MTMLSSRGTGVVALLCGVIMAGFAMPDDAHAAGGVLVQEHYRWRNDDGSESGASWKANADTPVTDVGRGSNIRLRFSVSGNVSAAPKLQYATGTGGPWSDVSPVADGLSPFVMTASANFVNGDWTTAQLTGPGTFLAGRMVEYPSNTAGAVVLTSNKYTNIEYNFQATPKARGGATYYFSLSGMTTVSNYARLAMTAAEANVAPQIVSPLVVTGSVLNGISYTMQATGGEPITYGASGLPSGVTRSGAVISGKPTQPGTYPVALTAANAAGSNAATLAMTIRDYQPPVASNQSFTMGPGGEITIDLGWSDWDQPELTNHTFTIVEAPSSGTLTSYFERNGATTYPNRYYFRADNGFIGTVDFTWRCNDKRADSNAGTVTVVVTPNTVPVASGGTASGASGSQLYCPLTVTDADNGQTMSRTIVKYPVHGSIESQAPQFPYCYYTGDPGYIGSDFFVWKCSDGIDDSNMATVNVTVAMAAPVPQAQSASTAKNTPFNIPASLTGGGGYSYAAEITEGPYSGNKVSVTNGLTFRFAPASNYLGLATFKWRLKYWQTGQPTNVTAAVTVTVTMKEPVYGKDWPMWRFDENRTAATLSSLPDTLHLQWRRDFPVSEPAWKNMYSVFNTFELTHRPVVMGKAVFVGLNVNDCMAAFDTDTGTNLWKFYASAPIRCAPAAVNGRVYFGSDDGWFYCLNATNGAVLWKLLAGPTERKLVGNNRLVSVWPVRGGVVYKNGKVYFAAGLWTAEGIFAYCLDAVTGAVVWKNDSISGLVTLMQHGHNAPRGFPPQGSLVFSTDGNTIYVPAGMSDPARLDAATGAVTWWEGSGSKIPNRWGWYVDQTGWSSYNEPNFIMAGARTYTAADILELEGMSGSLGSMLAADDKLFVMTSQGSLYCYGGTDVSNPPAYPLTTTPLPATSDTWTTAVQTMLSRDDLKQGMATVWGIGSGRLVEELVRQTTSLKIVAFDPDAGKVAALRAKMDAAGVYGTRVAAFTGAPMSVNLPPYLSGLIASEDVTVAGIGSGQAFAESLFRCTRPFGGEIWLPTSSSEHTTFSGWVAASTNMSLSTLTRNGSFTRLQRTGMTANEANIKPPLGVLWYQDYSRFSDVPNKGQITTGTGTLDLYTGLPLLASTPGSQPTPVPAYMETWIYNTFMRTNSIYGLTELAGYVGGYGCDSGRRMGSWHLERAGGFAYGETGTDSGTIYVSDARSGCTTTSGYMGNGVVYAGLPACSCAYTLSGSTLALAPMPDVESWAQWSALRTKRRIDEDPVRRIGINFGAPSDRNLSEDKVVWIHHPKKPSVVSPAYPIYYKGAVTSTYHHMSRVIAAGGAERPWVSASSVSGMTGITVRLAWPLVALQTANPPTIDGTLGDTCWQDAKRVRMPATDTRSFMLRYDNNNLYIAGDMPVNYDYYPELRWFVVRLGRRDAQAGDVVLGMNVTGSKKSVGLDASAWTAARTGSATVPFRVEMSVPWSALEGVGLSRTQLVANVIAYFAQLNGNPWDQSIDPPVQQYYSPVYLDTATGPGATARSHRIRLYFAETEGASAGQRVFDVKLQGQTVLTDFDIASQAGGQNKEVIREFQNIQITDDLNLDFVSKAGVPLISGMEIVEMTSPVNQPPTITSTLTASVQTGQAFSYTITASGSTPITYGASSLPEGLTLSGATISGTPPAAGTYNIGLTANNAYGSASKTLVLTVVTPVLTTITVSPSSAGVAPAGTQQFSASGKDQFGNVMSSQPAFAWSVSGGGSINSASGLFTAGATEGGPYTVTASAGGKSGTASVSVSAMPVGLLAWWKFDESSGTTAADASGNGHVATLQNTAVFAAGGRTGNALQLTGASDDALASPVVTLTTDWTITAWFTAPLPNTATWHTLTRGQSGDHHIIADSSLNLGVYSTDFRSCGYNLGGLSSGWHHVTAVGSGSTTTFYVDGVYAGSSDRKATGDVYAIGNWQGGGQRFTDKIDDVRVYNRALAASEIQALVGTVAGVDSYGIPDAWKVLNFGSVTAANAGAMDDADSDGMCNLAEYIAGTSPTNAASVLKVQGAVSQDGTLGLSFLSVTGRVYTGRYCDDLLAGSWGVLAPGNVPGTGGQITITDTNKPVVRFYRLGVK